MQSYCRKCHGCHVGDVGINAGTSGVWKVVPTKAILDFDIGDNKTMNYSGKCCNKLWDNSTHKKPSGWADKQIWMLDVVLEREGWDCAKDEIMCMIVSPSKYLKWRMEGVKGELYY